MSRTPAQYRKASPCIGEDSRTVLKECLGMDAQEIEALVEAGVVEAPARDPQRAAVEA